MTVYQLWVHLADNEWSSQQDGRIMENLAREYAAQFQQRPLKVTVNEHGGWWLTWLFDSQHDGLVIGSANDMAKWRPEQEAARQRYYSERHEHLGSIRRGS